MDAPCKIQGSIHVFRLVNNMCPGKWVHIIFTEPFFIIHLFFYYIIIDNYPEIFFFASGYTLPDIYRKASG